MSIEDAKKANMATYWLPLLSGIILTLAIAWGLNYHNEYEVKSYTNDIANKTEALINQRFRHFEYGLRSVRGAMSAVGVNKINREQFEEYSNNRNLEQEFPGALGFGYIRRVPIDKESEFIEETRITLGLPDFSIRTLIPHDKDRFVIQHIYPLDKNQQALGLDIGSESNRRAAALAAARNDTPYLTAPITLVQANNKTRKGALVLLPVYPTGVNLATIDSREKYVLGWSYAPLVIDDVLANLESEVDNAQITLTNTADNEPFYFSKLPQTSHAQYYQRIRNIYVLGQSWQLLLSPSKKMINQIKPWNISWILLLGLMLTFCLLFINHVLRAKHVTEDIDTLSHQFSIQSVVVFLKSAQFKQSVPSTLILFGFILFFASWLIAQNTLHKVSDNLSITKDSAITALEDEATKYRRDVLFLASTPVINSLITANNNQSSAAQNKAFVGVLNEGLANIFKAYMLSKTDVHQVRFIRADATWQEHVKVQRNGEELKTFEVGQLQSKKNEPYIGATLQAGLGGVFTSDMNLNRELDKVERPYRPIWRFSTPLFNPDGSPFGIIIINVNAQNVLTHTTNNIAENNQLYITNTLDEFLLHPEKFKAFSFDHAHPYRWQDEYTPATLLNNFKPYDLISYSGHQGYIFAKHTPLPISKTSDDRILKIYSATPQFIVFKEIAIKLTGVIVSLLFVYCISLMVQYWIWLSGIIRHRDNMKAQIESQRAEEISRFKGLLESAPDATLVVNDSGIIQMINAQAETMFGYPRKELEQCSIEKLVPNHLKDRYKSRIADYLNQVKEKNVDRGIELLALDANGHEIPIEVSLSSINLDDKMSISASVRNISERLMAEKKLQTALREAEQATEAKSAFLANTSHEIRTPLNAIIGLGYLLAEEPLTNAQHQLVSKIQISGTSLLGIVNDVLDLAKIEADEMMIEENPVELQELIEEISGVFSIQAEAKNLEFTSELDPNLPSWIISDSIRLRQVLGNLLSNSLKFTTIGRITICVEVMSNESELPADHINVRFSVKDTGIGISHDAQTHLFKPFTQADSSTTRRFGGTGLGLSIVRQLVQIMGGEIGVESTVNQGSKFWVDLTFKVQSVEEIVMQDNQNQTLFVLIAEDDPADAIQLQKMTRALGWRSEVVTNGDELVKTYLGRQENKLRPPDAMIVDWQMPVMDGITAIASLADHVGIDNLPAILMISAHDKNEIILHDSKHLVNNFLMKPVNSSTLFNSVNDIVTSTTGNAKRVMQSTHTQAVAAKWLPNVEVLVVDDSSINLIVVSHILEHNGAIVQTASSGEEALTLLEDSSNNYDAILMDVQMPGLDGLETTRRIRQQLKLVNVPIIALTAGALLEEKKRALDSGMNDFLTKPIDPSKLINVLRTLVESYREKLLAIESIQSSDTEGNQWPEISGLNMYKAKGLLLNDKQLLLSTLDGLLLEHENLCHPPADDFDNLEHKDLRLQLASQIHKLRSSAGMIGAEKIQEYSADAEELLRSGGRPVQQVLINLSKELSSLKQASSSILDSWKEMKSAELSQTSSAPELKIETLKHILTLLSEQDLGVIEIIENSKQSLHEALGETLFQELDVSLTTLNYKDAAQVLEPLLNRYIKA